MGLFSRLNIFKRRPKEEEKTDYSSVGLPAPSLGMGRTPSTLISNEIALQDNTRAKLDLMMTQIDGMRIQQESISERVQQIEKIVKQLLDMAKS